MATVSHQCQVYALLSRVDTQWPDFSRMTSTFFIPFCHTKFQIPAFSPSHCAHFSTYSSYSFLSFCFAILFCFLLFSFALIYIFVRFLLFIPLISQPILHILSHPFALTFYSVSFCFHSPLFIFLYVFSFSFRSFLNLFFIFFLILLLCHFILCPFVFIHSYLYFSFSFDYSLIFVCLFQHPFFSLSPSSLSLSLSVPVVVSIPALYSFTTIIWYHLLLPAFWLHFIYFFCCPIFLLSHSSLFISQSSSLSSRCSTHCSNFLILSHSPFVVPSVCYPHFLFPHSSHSFRTLPLTICQHLYHDLTSCVASVGPPP